MIFSSRQALLAAAALVAGASAHAGTVFYAAIPGTGSDTQSGIDPQNAYTAAVGGRNAGGAATAINGANFIPLQISGNSATATGLTLSAATGTLANGGGKTSSIHADGALGQALATYTFNDGADNGSEQYLVLDPATLTSGKTYDLRVYIGNFSGQNRQVDLSFAGDGQAAVGTDYFNEDDATSSPGGFSDPNQVYYIDYRFTWDGTTTPGVTITQRLGSTPFCLFLVTNQEVPQGAASPLPPGAIAEPPALQTAANGVQTSNDVEDAPPEVPEDAGSNSDVGVSSDTFYSAPSLQNNGRWVDAGSYGTCWQPSNVAADWSPYTQGQWRYATNGGWTWDSSEDFGWATYHYGRWFHADAGWCWAPGRVWAPSWCSWRFGGGHVGWAPLPPESNFQPSVGISIWADTSYGIGPGAYHFCNVADISSNRLNTVILPAQQNVAIINKTTNITNITYNKNIVYSGGPNFTTVNNAIVHAGGHPLVPLRISRRAGVNPLGPNGRLAQVNGNTLLVSAPSIKPAPPGHLPPIAAKLSPAKVDKGWGQVTDPKVAASLKAKFAHDTGGLTPQNGPAILPGSLGGKVVKPGNAIVSQPGVGGMKPGAVLKPGQTLPPGVAGGGHKPGQPITPGVLKPGAPLPGQANQNPQILRPGKPINKPENPETGVTGSTPPGKMLKPGERTPGTAVIVTPGQPAKTEELKKTENGQIPGLVQKPGQPINPAETKTEPNGQSIQKPGKNGLKPGKPGESVTPSEKGNPGGPATIPGLNQPGEQPPSPPKPGKKGANPPTPGEPNEAIREEKKSEPGQPLNEPGTPKAGKHKNAPSETPPKQNEVEQRPPTSPETFRPPAPEKQPKVKKPVTEEPEVRREPPPPSEQKLEGKQAEEKQPKRKENPEKLEKPNKEPAPGNPQAEGQKGEKHGKAKATPAPDH